MRCPDCGHENIPGVAECESCGQSLVDAQASGGCITNSICSNSVDVLPHHAPITVSPEIPVRDAVRTMVDRKIGCLLVEDAGKLVGIFTERDVLNRLGDDLGDGSVADYMTPKPASIAIQDSIAYALHTMDMGHYRHLAVVDDTGVATGVVSVRDVLHFLCDQINGVEEDVD